MIDEALIQEVTEDLCSAALRRVPPGTIRALTAAREREEHENARATLDLMLRSAKIAEDKVPQVESRGFLSHFRLSRMRVEDLGPLTVGIDAHDNSIYDRLETTARARLPAILEQLARHREAAGEV
jgi:hypothetical protein